MHFLATEPSTDTNIIDNDGWFPDIDLKAMRDTARLDGTVTTARLTAAVVDAMLTINFALKEWQQQQLANGHVTLADVPADTINKQSILLAHYNRAVTSTAKADLIEKYRDYDTTNSSQTDRSKTNYLDNAADQERRNAHWAIANILGRPHMTVELI